MKSFTATVLLLGMTAMAFGEITLSKKAIELKIKEAQKEASLRANHAKQRILMHTSSEASKTAVAKVAKKSHKSLVDAANNKKSEAKQESKKSKVQHESKGVASKGKTAAKSKPAAKKKSLQAHKKKRKVKVHKRIRKVKTHRATKR